MEGQHESWTYQVASLGQVGWLIPKHPSQFTYQPFAFLRQDAIFPMRKTLASHTDTSFYKGS